MPRNLFSDFLTIATIKNRNGLLLVLCSKCDHQSYVDLEELDEQTKVKSLIGKLRCTKCGSVGILEEK